jgi:hypothetical protein
MNLSRPILAATAATLIAVFPLSAFEFPLSDSASRSAYFLGQRHDETVGDFFARYTKHLPPPNTGLYVSDISFLTPFAQLVEYSGHQGIYSAQQAELDGRRKFQNVEIAVYVYFNNAGVFPVALKPSSNSTGAAPPADMGSSWHEYTVRVFDGEELREPASVAGQSQLRCVNHGGCIRVGVAIFLSLPAEVFVSDSASVQVATPDGQLVTAEFDLANLR